ncbi:MAG: hypothetical protein QNK11_08680, partial [Legionella sp.]|nr:hypothetical protein [Legionella sp.]
MVASESKILALKNKLKKQIGHYNVKKPGILSYTFLTGGLKEKLYKNTDKMGESKSARQAFIDHMFSLERSNGVSEQDEAVAERKTKRDKDIADGKPENATTTLEDLLDEKGVELYQAALEEERKSKSFMKACFKASLIKVPGNKWLKKLVMVIGGVSASGKSFSTPFLLDEAAKKLDCSNESEGNMVSSIDGGIPREQSQMRKLAIQFSLYKGYTGISDLHEQSDPILKNVKKDL